MKRSLTILLLLFTSSTMFAQIPSFSWEQTLSTNFHVNGYQTDTSGNIVLVGDVSGTADFDIGPGVSSWTTPNYPPCCPTADGYIAKYNSSGMLLWKILFSSIYNESVVALTLDDAGNIYIKASGVDSIVDLDPGPGSVYLSHPGDFIAKYSSSGALLWMDQIKIYAAKMCIDPSTNDLLVAGTYYGTVDMDPSATVLSLSGGDTTRATFFMSRFNSSGGQLIWADNFYNSSSAANSLNTVDIKADLLGDIFLAGAASGTVDLDPAAGTSNITNFNYIAKYNSAGQLVLLQPFPANTLAFDIDGNNNIAFSGDFNSLVDFNLGAGTNDLDAGPASNDFFISKYDSNLNYIWAFTHSNTANAYSQVESIHFDNNNNIIVKGNYDVPFVASDFDPGTGMYIIPAGTHSNFIAKYAASSDLLGFAKLNGLVSNNTSTTYLNKINNKLLLLGSETATVDFDLGPGVYSKPIAYNETFLARYDLTCASNPVYASDTICYGDTLHYGTTSLYSSGNFPVLLTSAAGCDSTLVMNLTVRPQIVTNLNIVLCSAQYYFFNGMNLNTPGIYHDTLVSYTGCDSIVNLTLSTVPVNYSVTQSGYVLTSAETSATSYQWYNCTSNSIIPGATGIAFSVGSSDNYAAIISKAGCLDTTSCMPATGSGGGGIPPTNVWGNQYSTLGAQFYKVDQHGNSYLVGNDLPEVDLDPDTSVFMPPYEIIGMYILKYSPSGAFLWARWIQTGNGNIIYDVDVDSTGAIYLTGGFETDIDMDAGPGTTILSNSGTASIFLCKYDASGNFQWAHSFGGIGENYAQNVAVDKTNNVYIGGYYEDDIDFDPGAGTSIVSTASNTIWNYIAKYDPSGNYVSASGIDSWIQIEKLTIDNANNIIYAGSFWDSADLDPGVGTFLVNDLSPGSQQNTFIAKVDQSYNFIAGMSISSDQLTLVTDITTDAANNILTTGVYRSGVIDFDAGTGTPSLPYAGNDDVYLAKYTPSGNFVWAKQVANTDPDHSTVVVTDPSSNSYVMGKYSNSIDVDGTPGMLLLNCSGATDNYVTTYDAAGNFNWAFRVGSPQDDDPVGMGLDNVGNVYVCGNSTDSVPFMMAHNGYERSVLSGAYVAKYGACDMITNSVTDNGAYFTADQAGVTYQWYDCATNLPIAGATSQSYYPTVNGQYSVSIGTGACAQMSACNTFTGATALAEKAGDQFRIYPNPAKDRIVIESANEFILISVTDLTGKELIRVNGPAGQQKITLSTASLNDGMYVVTIRTKDGVRKEKIIVTR